MSVLIVFDTPFLTTKEVAFLQKIEKRAEVSIIYLKQVAYFKILFFLKIHLLCAIEIFLQKTFKISRDFNLNKEKAFLYGYKLKSTKMQMSHASLVINFSSIELMDERPEIIGIRNHKGEQESIFKIVEKAFKAKNDHISVDIHLDDVNKKQMRYELEKFFLNDFLNVQSRILFHIQELCDDLL